MTTRNGIYYDLTLSIYSFKIENIEYVFSSKLHLVKFKNKYIQHRTEFSKALSKRYSMVLDLPYFADMVLYMKIESRGFLVRSGGLSIWKENLIFDGRKARLKE